MVLMVVGAMAIVILTMVEMRRIAPVSMLMVTLQGMIVGVVIAM